MQLILIRHGRPERIDHDPDGANPPLTELGHKQAAAMAKFLEPEPIDALYVSPQQRAIDTATPLAAVLDHAPTVVEGIAEFDLGHSSYIPGEERPPLTTDEIAELMKMVSAKSFQDRVHEAINSIISAHAGETVAAVCHGGVISTVLADLLGVNPMTYFNSKYTSVTRIKASDNGHKSMMSFNECHWLREF